MRSTNTKGFLLALIAASLWGVSGTFGQFLFQQRGVSVEWMITVRMLISGIILLLIGAFGKIPTYWPYGRIKRCSETDTIRNYGYANGSVYLFRCY